MKKFITNLLLLTALLNVSFAWADGEESSSLDEITTEETEPTDSDSTYDEE